MIKWLKAIYSDELQSHETFEAIREKVKLYLFVINSHF